MIYDCVGDCESGTLEWVEGEWDCVVCVYVYMVEMVFVICAEMVLVIVLVYCIELEYSMEMRDYVIVVCHLVNMVCVPDDVSLTVNGDDVMTYWEYCVELWVVGRRFCCDCTKIVWRLYAH